MRGRILALMPKHMIAAGIAQAKLTLAGGNEKPISERLIAMTAAFKKFGVTSDMLKTYLGHDVDNTTIDELADLMGTYNAIKEGAKASDFFPTQDKQDSSATTAAAITNQVKQAASQSQDGTSTAAPAAKSRNARSSSTQMESTLTKETVTETGQKADPTEVPETKPAASTQAATKPAPAAQQADGADEEVF
jgi:hypothetical protein